MRKKLNMSLCLSLFLSYHKVQIMIKQGSYTEANESGEEAEKGTMRVIDIGLSQS